MSLADHVAVGMILEGPAAAAALPAIDRREAIGSSGIGRGVAFPHARTAAVSRLTCAPGVVRPPPTDAGAIDAAPVDRLVLLLAPADPHGRPPGGRAPELAHPFGSPGLVARLRAAARPEELLGILAGLGRRAVVSLPRLP